MPTDAEIEAATLAILEKWKATNNPVGAHFAFEEAARAALDAAEKVRRESRFYR